VSSSGGSACVKLVGTGQLSPTVVWKGSGGPQLMR
jgi:hypothetical protein